MPRPRKAGFSGGEGCRRCGVRLAGEKGEALGVGAAEGWGLGNAEWTLSFLQGAVPAAEPSLVSVLLTSFALVFIACGFFFLTS